MMSGPSQVLDEDVSPPVFVEFHVSCVRVPCSNTRDVAQHSTACIIER